MGSWMENKTAIFAFSMLKQFRGLLEASEVWWHPRPPLSVEDIISRFREMAQ